MLTTNVCRQHIAHIGTITQPPLPQSKNNTKSDFEAAVTGAGRKYPRSGTTRGLYRQPLASAAAGKPSAIRPFNASERHVALDPTRVLLQLRAWRQTASSLRRGYARRGTQRENQSHGTQPEKNGHEKVHREGAKQ